jgi:hypothetical protein
MKKTKLPKPSSQERDTMRSSYDFSGGVRGVTATRYASGVNVVVIDPDLLDIFPNSASVNDALRALAPLLRRGRTKAAKPRAVSAVSRKPPKPRPPTTRRRGDA